MPKQLFSRIILAAFFAIVAASTAMQAQVVRASNFYFAGAWFDQISTDLSASASTSQLVSALAIKQYADGRFLGLPVNMPTLADGDVPTWDVPTGQWIAAQPTTTAVTMGGDITGPSNAAVIGNGAVTLLKMASNSVDATKIVDNSIGILDIGTGAVGTDEIANATVALADLASNSVDASKIVDNSIGFADIGTGAVGTDEIANLSVALGDMAANSVDASKIVDGSILAADLNQMGATTGQNLQWNGTAWAPTTPSVVGTDISVTTTPTDATVISNTGADGVLSGATATAAGLVTTAGQTWAGFKTITNGIATDAGVGNATSMATHFLLKASGTNAYAAGLTNGATDPIFFIKPDAAEGLRMDELGNIGLGTSATSIRSGVQVAADRNLALDRITPTELGSGNITENNSYYRIDAANTAATTTLPATADDGGLLITANHDDATAGRVVARTNTNAAFDLNFPQKSAQLWVRVADQHILLADSRTETMAKKQIKKTADQAFGAITHANVTDFVTPTLLAGREYQIDAILRWSSAATTTGAGFGYTFSGTIECNVETRTSNTSTYTSAGVDQYVVGNFVAGPSTGAAATNNSASVKCRCRVTSDGTWQLTARTEVAASNITVIASGSVLTVHEIK